MKKLIIICILMLCFTVSVKASDGIIDNTGHDDIIQMGFCDQFTTKKFLVEYSVNDLEKAYKEIKNVGFGWSLKTLVDEKKIWYISEIVFSKSNRTSQYLRYDYSLKESEEVQEATSKSGSLSIKGNTKIKGVTLNVESGLKGEVSHHVKSYFEEKMSFSVEVMPGKKVSLRLVGEGTVSNGVGKYYFLGIPFKKGTWENITKGIESYELYEEDL